MNTPNLIPLNNQSPLSTFWMAGFECADHQNAFGNRVDLLAATRHVDRLDEDYDNLGVLNIRTVREGIQWSRVEPQPYTYDWSVIGHMIIVGRRHNIQQIWDICHFGFPADLTPLHPMFARRFAALCTAFARFYRSVDGDGDLIITPINEVSFLSWLGGDARGTVPYCVGQGWEVKYRLMKAYIEGVEALKAVDPRIRIMTTEPLVNITSNSDASIADKADAQRHHDDQFQVTDILGGRMCPELRGRPEYLDFLGYNFYYNNQWVWKTGEMLVWKRQPADHRWIPLHRLLQQAYARYLRPLILSETSHPQEDRPLWMDMIAQECVATHAAGIPLLGVCWYPIIDRPDWDHLDHWHQSGLWDRAANTSEEYERQLHEPTAQAFLRAQLTTGKCSRQVQIKAAP